MNLQTRTSQTTLPPARIKKIEERAFEVRYIQNLNLVIVKGWSITSDIHSKYGQLLIDIENHLNARNTLNFHFKYELFNSSSAKYLFTIIKRLNKADAVGKSVKVYWSCASENEEEMFDTGIDLAGMCDFKFEITYC